ncbi:MAG: hypothetical protein MI757_17070 [Pirellulales bacterium]|nr:hypothetical protein [Pirellulales bacterium]
MQDFHRDIDLLVDGELPEERRRKLLADMDATDGGWRRLALAFVEAQTMREALENFVDEPRDALPAAAVVPTKAIALGPSHMTFWAAVAASFLIALAIGLSIRGEPSPLANQPATTNEPKKQPPREAVPSPAPNDKQPAVLAADDADDSPFGQATLLVSDHGSEPRRVKLPVVFAQDGEPLRQLSDRASIPPDVQHALERMGYRVQQQRSVVRRPLGDGREMFVPVNQVDVNYVGTPAYQ